MAKFIKKPVVVEAVQFKAHRTYINALRKGLGLKDSDELPITYIGEHAIIKTLEGDMKVSDGDYIIKDIQGEFYPCKPDIFEATYETAAIEKKLSDGQGD